MVRATLKFILLFGILSLHFVIADEVTVQEAAKPVVATPAKAVDRRLWMSEEQFELYLKNLKPKKDSAYATVFFPKNELQVWNALQKKYPEARTRHWNEYLTKYLKNLYSYPAFQKNMDKRPIFYLADCLSESLWSPGAGLLFIHAGLFQKIATESDLLFLLTLEIAHHILGHTLKVDLPEKDKVKEGKSIEEMTALNKEANQQLQQMYIAHMPHPLDSWTLLNLNDPISALNLAYSLEDEKEALKWVRAFFHFNFWQFEKSFESFLVFLKKQDLKISSYFFLHKNLVHFKNDLVEPSNLQPVVLDNASYLSVLQSLEHSPMQKNRWLAERYMSFKDSESNLLSGLYIVGKKLLENHEWQAVIKNAERALLLRPSSEPFLYQKVIALFHQKKWNEVKAIIQASDSGWLVKPELRSLLEIQLLFLTGLNTQAEQKAKQHLELYLFDVDATFWDTLIAIRLKKTTVEEKIYQMEALYGLRPWVRTLLIIYYTYLKKEPELKKVVEFKPAKYGLAYGADEMAFFDFSKLWSSYYLPTGIPTELDPDALEKELQASKETAPAKLLLDLVELHLPKPVY